MHSPPLVIEVGEALDHKHASAFKALFREHIDQGVSCFVLDFSDTSILDSTGLGAIFSLHRQVAPKGGEVAFAAVSKPVKVVVQLTRTYKIFRQFETRKEACQALEEDHVDARKRENGNTREASA